MTPSERTFYVLHGTYTLAMFFIAPVYPLFLLSRGLDLFEINVVLAVYLITVFLFEVPTGAFADRYGRRISFLLSCALRTVAYTLYAFAEGFSDCLVAEVIDGIGTTLASGALEAWAVDGRAAEGAGRNTDRFFARAQVLGRVTMIGGGIACSHLAARDWRIPWLMSAMLFVAAGVYASMYMREERRPVGASPRRIGIGHTITEGMRILREAPILLLICALTAAAFFALAPVHMQWQARLAALGAEDIRITGWVWALVSLAALVGSAVLPPLLDRFRRERVLFAATVWRAVFLAIAAASTTVSPMLAALLLQEIGYGLTEPVQQAWLNEHVPSEQRATMISIRSMLGTFGGSVGLVILGRVSLDFGIPVVWMIAAGVVALSAPPFLLLGRLARQTPPREPIIETEPVPAKPLPPTVA